MPQRSFEFLIRPKRGSAVDGIDITQGPIVECRLWTHRTTYGPTSIGPCFLLLGSRRRRVPQVRPMAESILNSVVHFLGLSRTNTKFFACVGKHVLVYCFSTST